ncbi:hypothetical protein HHX48_02530 [Salinimonas sp. HHU 13199]|uniref:DUF2214 domain-containing protein n=1 Tax=Salinimonas profundi TaxID=2729140 RepID=A0ABR8LE90_9ALTE|nr:hypothetical protein [Salinimonas profundi]MBD3584609.1 hypothetical protein [Salinimonas profundi]
MFSFREKSLWVSLLVTVIIASIYADNIYHALIAGDAVRPQESAALILRVVVSFIIIEVVLHLALAMDNQRGAGEKEDERERGYRLVGTNAAYWVLAIGVISCIVQQVINHYTPMESSSAFIRYALAPIELKLLTIFWIAEMVRFTTELYLYRAQS